MSFQNLLSANRDSISSDENSPAMTRKQYEQEDKNIVLLSFMNMNCKAVEVFVLL